MARRNITITNGIDEVELLTDIEFEIQPQTIGSTATMVSGKTVMDIVGVKNTLTVPTGWLDRKNLQTLKKMINKDHVLTVYYPGVDGDEEGLFLVEQPTYKAVKYSDDGADIWLGVTLTMTQQGVVE